MSCAFEKGSYITQGDLELMTFLLDLSAGIIHKTQAGLKLRPFFFFFFLSLKAALTSL